MLRAVAGDGRRGRGLRPETGHAQRFRLHKITYMRGTRPFQTACNPHMWRYRASGPATTVRIEDDDTPQSVPHPDEINPENERKKFRSFHARPEPHPAFGEKERVLRTPPDEIRLSFPFQNNLTIKQD